MRFQRRSNTAAGGDWREAPKIYYRRRSGGRLISGSWTGVVTPEPQSLRSTERPPVLAQPAANVTVNPTSADTGVCDALVVAAFSWHLEIAAEICLSEVEKGRRVGFAFLDISNADEFPVDGIFASTIYALQHAARLRKVEVYEKLLHSHGVTIIDVSAAHPEVLLSTERLGIDSAESLREFRSAGAALGIGALSSLIHRTADLDPDVATCRRMTDRLLTSARQAFDITTGLIREFAPSTVYVYNGRLACTKGIAEAARLAATDLRYYEISRNPKRYYLSSRPPWSTDNAREILRLSWEQAAEDREATALRYFTPDRGGVPLIDRKFRQAQDPGRSIPPNGRRRIVYFVSSIDEYAAVEDGVEHPVFDSQRAAVEWLADWVAARPDIELVIRVHPRMVRLSRRERQWWASHSADNVTVLPAESAVDSYALAASADRVVCYHSSLAVEATYTGKVSILVGDADYRGLDCVYEPHTVAEFEAMLTDRSLQPKPRENCLPYGYSRLTWGTPFRYYVPRSHSEGTFFGEQIAPASKGTFPARATVKVLVTIDALIRSLRVRLRR